MMNGRIGGGNDPARSVYAAAHASRQSIAMPMNQLIQNRRYMIENIARASGGGVGVNRRWLFGSNQAVAPVEAEPVRAAPPQAQGSANPPGSNNMIHEARAEPGNRGNRDYNYINYINNINIYNVNRENDNNYDDDDDNDDDYNIINNNRVSFQEQADIEEAIRRSLMD
jgi:phosphopantothenoylcysteine synthetase/decarboxylase